jgi:hypothetical protein
MALVASPRAVLTVVTTAWVGMLVLAAVVPVVVVVVVVAVVVDGGAGVTVYVADVVEVSWSADAAVTMYVYWPTEAVLSLPAIPPLDCSPGVIVAPVPLLSEHPDSPGPNTPSEQENEELTAWLTVYVGVLTGVEIDADGGSGWFHSKNTLPFCGSAPLACEAVAVVTEGFDADAST